MKILSIDVGVKNLAICLFEVINKDDFKILIWDVVDLENTVTYKCNCMCKKTTKTCDKKASYMKEDQFFCKTHAKNTEFIIPTKEFNTNKLSKLKMADLLSLCDKYHILTPLQKTLKLLKSDIVNIMTSFTKEKMLSPANAKSNKVVDLVSLGKNLLASFDTIFHDHSIDLVLIENQISPLAMKMKTLQGMISQYFIMRNVNDIKFVSSKNKLKHFEETDTKSSYSERKKMSIKVCHDILVKNKHIIDNFDIFEKSNKKDDLADSFLQGLVYLSDFNIIHYDF